MMPKKELTSPIFFPDNFDSVKYDNQSNDYLTLQVKHWRQWQRKRLIIERIAISNHHRKLWQQDIQQRLKKFLYQLEPGTIGFYWPYKGEIDLRALVTDLLKIGWTAALPAVNQVASPLEFRRWTPETTLSAGVWKIPTPKLRQLVIPTALVIPLVGFDNNHYRLGYGGGYYDRTIATMQPRPINIGVGFEQARLTTIYPQNHDVSMDIILTELGTYL